MIELRYNRTAGNKRGSNSYWLFIDFTLITHSEILIRSSGHPCYNRQGKTRELGRLHRKDRLQKTNNFHLAAATLRLSGSGLKKENRWTRHVILLTSGVIKCWVPSNYRKMSLLFNFSCCGMNGPITKLDFFNLSKVCWLRALFALNLKNGRKEWIEIKAYILLAFILLWRLNNRVNVSFIWCNYYIQSFQVRDCGSPENYFQGTIWLHEENKKSSKLWKKRNCFHLPRILTFRWITDNFLYMI